MNKEELIGKLQMVYVGDRNALNELVGYYDGLKQENKEQEEYIEYWQKEYDKKCEVIDKAIEYIENYTHKEELNIRVKNYNFNLDILLEILKGKTMNKEERTISPNQIKEAIDKLLDEKEQLQDEVYKLKEEIQELKADYGNKAQVERDLLQLRIDKVIDQLYCWVDVIRPDIQLSLLEILKGE